MDTSMSHLERIFAEGTQVPIRPISTISERAKQKPSRGVVCADGFTMSVSAGIQAYCTPTPQGLDASGTPFDYAGPYTHVEVYDFSERPKPWKDWKEYEAPYGRGDVVYKYVPITLVRALVEAHGGEADE